MPGSARSRRSSGDRGVGPPDPRQRRAPEASLATDRQPLSAGISCRGLFHSRGPRATRHLGLSARRDRDGVGRAHDGDDPIRMLIFDDEYAIVPIEADSVAGLITDPVVVALLHDIFGFLWSGAGWLWPRRTRDVAR